MLQHPNASLFNKGVPPPFQVSVSCRKRANELLNCFPDVRLVVSDTSHRVLGVWDPHTHTTLDPASLQATFQLDRFNSYLTYGIIGSFCVGGQLWLGLIDQVEQVATVLGNAIFTPRKVSFIHLSAFETSNSMLTCPDTVKLELETYQDLLESGGFYFSYTYQLWNHTQFNALLNQAGGTADQQLAQSQERLHRYVWNLHLSGITLNDPHPFLVPMVRGFFESQPLPGDQSITVLSRIDQRNAGTRFTVRGLNEHGVAAMSIENELVIESPDAIVSHLQYRASLPLRWTQATSQLAYKPPVNILDSTSSYATVAHFNDMHLNVLPGNIHILNLLRTTEDESRLSNALSEKLSNLGLNNVHYHHIPLGWGAASLNEVLNKIETPLKFNGHFFAYLNPGTRQISQIVHLQSGLFRTNCMDCMDRTSIAQFGMVHRILPNLLQSLHSSPKDFQLAEASLRHLWADMANALASYNTGTGIVNEAIIRHGADCPSYSWKDQIICGTRYFLNNTHDLPKKFWLNRFLRLCTAPTPSTKLPGGDLNLLNHIKHWQGILGRPPSYKDITVSTYYIDSLNQNDLQNLSAKFLSDLLKLASLSDYCLIHRLNSDELLANLFNHAL